MMQQIPQSSTRWLKINQLLRVRPSTLTLHGDLSGPDQVTLVAHEDDGNVFGLAGAS